MTNLHELESLEKFVIDVLQEEPSGQEVYGYISRYSKDDPFWCLFLVYEGSEGEKFFGGYYPLNITNMESLVDIFSLFSNQERKIIINTKSYFD